MIKRWTQQEDNFLAKNYSVLSAGEIIDRIDKSWKTITKRVSRLRAQGVLIDQRPQKILSFDEKEKNTYTQWTNEQDQYLLSLNVNNSVLEVSEILQRTPGAIEARIKTLRSRGYNVPTLKRDHKTVQNGSENAKKIVMRDEIAAQITNKVKNGYLTIQQAKFVAEYIRETFLKTKNGSFNRYEQQSINSIVEKAIYKAVRLPRKPEELVDAMQDSITPTS